MKTRLSFISCILILGFFVLNPIHATSNQGQETAEASAETTPIEATPEPVDIDVNQIDADKLNKVLSDITTKILEEVAVLRSPNNPDEPFYTSAKFELDKERSSLEEQRAALAITAAVNGAPWTDGETSVVASVNIEGKELEKANKDGDTHRVSGGIDFGISSGEADTVALFRYVAKKLVAEYEKSLAEDSDAGLDSEDNMTERLGLPLVKKIAEATSIADLNSALTGIKNLAVTIAATELAAAIKDAEEDGHENPMEDYIVEGALENLALVHDVKVTYEPEAGKKLRIGWEGEQDAHYFLVDRVELVVDENGAQIGFQVGAYLDAADYREFSTAVKSYLWAVEAMGRDFETEVGPQIASLKAYQDELEGEIDELLEALYNDFDHLENPEENPVYRAIQVEANKLSEEAEEVAAKLSAMEVVFEEMGGDIEAISFAGVGLLGIAYEFLLQDDGVEDYENEVTEQAEEDSTEESSEESTEAVEVTEAE